MSLFRKNPYSNNCKESTPENVGHVTFRKSFMVNWLRISVLLQFFIPVPYAKSVNMKRVLLLIKIVIVMRKFFKIKNKTKAENQQWYTTDVIKHERREVT